MVKKFMSMLFAGVATLVLSGCGGGSSDNPEAVLDVYYLTDDFGFGVNGVPYDCESGYFGDTGDGGSDGDFDFDPRGDSCYFDLSVVTDELYIEDENYNGVAGLDYICSPSTKILSTTENFGWLEYFDTLNDTSCTIYFPSY
jgi:hypothetical protein